MNIRTVMGAILMLLTATLSHAETVLIGNPGLHFSSLPLSQVSRIFLGQSSQLPDGSAAIPLDVSGGSREQFYRDVLKKSPEQIEKYWARMIFTGKAQPPREIRPGDVKSVVAETPGAISYIDSSKVDGSVKVIHIDSSH